MSGRGYGRGRAGSTKDETSNNFHIVWETTTDTGCTSKMVKCAPHPEGRASRRTKLEICAVVCHTCCKICQSCSRSPWNTEKGLL
ncbi:hypothetical protein PAXRUDRAFT_826219 [Paxillus rubicundulus Ve08.2h10]|uniref:Uncharacterized protein n=1 Tax=Paxillus rubicundulus Ve08.2h10 TaxID=930991 RepID=A0A0D0E4P7_9AGAM|nr:hypothetical protein PAXRUDRAFT_826219 [Paxillus rubicundulus Ve08.2h10]